MTTVPPLVASQPQPAARSDGASPHAVIWIGGLAEEAVNQSLESIAKRVAHACDRRDVAPARYSVRMAVSPEGEGTVPSCTILRTDAAGTRPVLDMFGLTVRPTLIGDRDRKSLITRLGLAAMTFARASVRAAKTRRIGRGKTVRERRQLLVARLFMVLLALGLVLLLGALAATLAVGDLPVWLRALEGGILFIGGLSIWKSKVAQRLGSLSLLGYSVVDYLDRADDRGDELRTKLIALLEQLAEREKPYESIDVIAYSFGSLVALDALFPATQTPPRRVATIDRLITLACPFDMVRAYWPDYFRNRYARKGAPGAWLNIYAPSDVLASNFRNDGRIDKAKAAVQVRAGQPEIGPPENLAHTIDGLTEPVSGWKLLTLKGLRLHAGYWSARVDHHETVFDKVIDHVGASTVR